MGFGGGGGFKGGAGDLGSDLKINDGTIKIKEQANAESDTTAYGQIWVKTATPNQLYFTTDAGNDIQITSGTGLAAAASSAAVNADDIQTGDAAVTIDTTVGNITLDAQATNADVIIKVDDGGSAVTAVTFDGSDAGRAIFNGTMTLGSDADGTDREIVFGHSTLKTIMGIDDSADAFVINTDDAFDGTLANNSLSIDASHNMIVAGNITSGGSFVIGSADMSETDLEKLDGITDGTAAANKAVVLDGSKNIATIGTVGCGAITSTGTSTFGPVSAVGALSGSSTLEVVGAVTSTGDIATSGSLSAGGDLTVTGADIIIGADADGTDRTVTFGHSTLKTIMGIDDSADAFVINTDAAFDGTLANNSLSIDASHNMIVAGNITGKGRVLVDDATDATSKTDGSLQTDGGLSVAKAIYNGTAATLAADSGITTIGSTTAATFSAAGLLNINNATEATSTTDGSLQTDGGLSVAKSAVIGDDLDLLSDGAIINFGTNKEITLTHVHDTGLTLEASAASTPVFEIKNAHNGATAGILKFNNTEAGTDGADGDDLGSVTFWGNDDGTPTAQQYAGILAEIDDATSDQESGKLTLQVASHDGGVESGIVLTGGSVDAEVDVTIGNGAASLTTIAGTSQFNGNATFGVDDTGVDVRMFSATADEGVLYDASEDELALLLTTKLKFHDVGGGEEIYASANGHLEVNAGTTLDMTAPTVDVNASTAVTIDTPGVTITDTTATSATEGGYLRLAANDGAVMADNHRLGVIEFAGAEDTSNTISIGARIQAICRDAWDGSNNDADLEFYTTDGTTESLVLTLDADKLATFAGAAQFNGNATFGVDDTGVDVRFFSATTNEGVLYDASQDELGLLLTTKLSFHDIGGDENIIASADGHLEVNAGTTLDMTAPTIDLNASTAITIDTDTATFSSANASDPLIVVKNTTNDTNGARIKFLKDKGTAAADNDVIGQLQFFGDNDAEEETEYAGIMAQVADASDGTEGGRLVLRVATHDGTLEPGITIADGDADEELDVTIGNGAASLVTAAGELKSNQSFYQGEGRKVIYEEVEVRHVSATDDTVSIAFGTIIPQYSVVTRMVAMVKTVSNLSTHMVNIRGGAASQSADTDVSSNTIELLGAGTGGDAAAVPALNTRTADSQTSSADIDLKNDPKEVWINDTPAFVTTSDVQLYVCNAGTGNGTTDATAGTLLIYVEYYGLD